MNRGKVNKGIEIVTGNQTEILDQRIIIAKIKISQRTSMSSMSW
jgi:hypothetical protein